MNQGNVTIDKVACERLCREVCRNFVPISSRAAHKEALLFAICQAVYEYLDEDFVLIPVQDSSHLEMYKVNLRMFVAAHRTEYFDALEIVEAHINETLDKGYQMSFKSALVH